MFLYNLRNVPFWHLVFTLWDISSKEKIRGIPGCVSDKEPACQCRRRRVMGLIPSWEDLLEEGITTHSSILAWEIPWTEKPGGLQSMGSQRVGHNWSNLAHTIGNTKKKWEREKIRSFSGILSDNMFCLFPGLHIWNGASEFWIITYMVGVLIEPLALTNWKMRVLYSDRSSSSQDLWDGFS